MQTGAAEPTGKEKNVHNQRANSFPQLVEKRLREVFHALSTDSKLSPGWPQLPHNPASLPLTKRASEPDPQVTSLGLCPCSDPHVKPSQCCYCLSRANGKFFLTFPVADRVPALKQQDKLHHKLPRRPSQPKCECNGGRKLLKTVMREVLTLMWGTFVVQKSVQVCHSSCQEFDCKSLSPP